MTMNCLLLLLLLLLLPLNCSWHRHHFVSSTTPSVRFFLSLFPFFPIVSLWNKGTTTTTCRALLSAQLQPQQSTDGARSLLKCKSKRGRQRRRRRNGWASLRLFDNHPEKQQQQQHYHHHRHQRPTRHSAPSIHPSEQLNENKNNFATAISLPLFSPHFLFYHLKDTHTHKVSLLLLLLLHRLLYTTLDSQATVDKSMFSTPLKGN